MTLMESFCKILVGIVLLTKVALSLDSSCHPIGDCIYCTEDELDYAYCRGTGKKQKYFCEARESSNREIFHSCELTFSQQSFRMYMLITIMGICGVSLYFFVQYRKRYSMSSFDARKFRRTSSNS